MSNVSNSLNNDFILFPIRANKLLDEGKIENALNLCEAGVRRFPFYAQGHYVLGLCYEITDQKEEAKREFERVIFYSPSHVKAMHKLIQIYEKQGLHQLANEWLVTEALYYPFDDEVIGLLKEKNLYEEIATPTPEPEIEEAVSEDPDIFTGPQIPEKPLTDDNEDVEISEEEHELTSNFDPLAPAIPVVETDEISNDENDEDIEVIRPKVPDLSQYANTEDDFSTLMDGFFDSETEEGVRRTSDDHDWMEVDGLNVESAEKRDISHGEEVDQFFIEETEESAGNDETKKLLKELSDSEEGDYPQAEENGIEENVGPDEREEINNAPEFVETDQSEEENIQEEILDKTDDEEIVQSEQQPVIPVMELSQNPEDDEASIEDMMENPNLITPTFGEILIAQHKFVQARHVFSELSKKEPDNTRFLKKIDFLDKMLDAQA